MALSPSYERESGGGAGRIFSRKSQMPNRQKKGDGVCLSFLFSHSFTPRTPSLLSVYLAHGSPLPPRPTGSPWSGEERTVL